MNARSARDKILRLQSPNGSVASCSMMETSRSSERRDSGKFSMLAKRNRPSVYEGVVGEPVDIPILKSEPTKLVRRKKGMFTNN